MLILRNLNKIQISFLLNLKHCHLLGTMVEGGIGASYRMQRKYFF